MDCQQAALAISREIDGELETGAKARLDAHLQSCADCRALRDEWLAVGAHMRADQPDVLPDVEKAWLEIRRAIRTGVPTERGKQLPFPLFTRWIPLAAAAAVVAAIGIHFWRPAPASGPALASAQDVEYVETDLPGASPLVYVDAKSGWTVVWVAESSTTGKQG